MINNWIVEYITYWRRVLLLHEWEISTRYMEHEEAEDNSSTRAEVSTISDSCQAIVSFSARLPESYDRDWEQTIVHELLHVRLASLIDFLYGIVLHHLSPQASEITAATIRHLTEPIVECLSSSFIMVRYGDTDEL